MALLHVQPPEYYIDGILKNDVMILSRAITLVESERADHQDLAAKILDAVIGKTGNSFRLGITGVPGVGKSSFIEKFGLHLLAEKHKVAVLAVDPSSVKSKGSILGDKTRMEQLAVQPNVYIRPSPSSGALGGVTRVTYETLLLCEAAGYDFIIVETVGVGQSEIEVGRITDFFLLLMLAGAGDELQGIKRGIMEVADALLFTKADGENEKKAKSARAEFAQALHLFPPSESGWIPKALVCSAEKNTGIKEVFDMLSQYKQQVVSSGYFTSKRLQQRQSLLDHAISEELMTRFYSNDVLKNELQKLRESELLQPFQAARELVKKFL